MNRNAKAFKFSKSLNQSGKQMQLEESTLTEKQKEDIKKYKSYGYSDTLIKIAIASNVHPTTISNYANELLKIPSIKKDFQNAKAIKYNNSIA